MVKYNHNIKLQNKSMVIIDILKTSGKILKEAGKIEQYEQIVDAQQKITEMQQRIISLEEDNKNLKEKLEIKGKIMAEENVYWVENGNKKDGPFCTCCYDSEYKLIRLHKKSHLNVWNCPKCKNRIDKEIMQQFSQSKNPLLDSNK
jgi:ribosomal protein L37AE/L43A